MDEHKSETITVIPTPIHSSPIAFIRGFPSLLSHLLAGFLCWSVLLGVAAADDVSEAQIQEWIHRLQTDPPEARHKLIATLRETAAPRSGHPPTRTSNRTDLLPVLESALENDDGHVRTEAICALCYMKNPAAFPLLEKAFDSRYGIVRYYASMGIEWIADMGDLRPRAIAALEKARDRRGEAFDVRLGAATALDKIGVAQDVDLFLEALRNPRANDALAAGVLSRMGRKDTIELMIVRLRTAVPSGDHWLAEALKKLTGQDLGTNAQAWQDWFNAHRAEFPEQLK